MRLPFCGKNDSRRDAAQSYNRDLETILRRLDINDTIVGKIAYLSFVVDVICRELEADDTAAFVRTGIAEWSRSDQYTIPYKRQSELRENVPLTPYHVITRPWNDERLCRAVTSEFIYGHLRHEDDTDAILYKDLNLVVVSNGRHHQTVAKQKHQEFVKKLYVVEPSDYMDDLSTNGERWFYTDSAGIKQECPCKEYRMALIFTLSQKRKALSGGIEVSEREHTSPMSADEIAADEPRFVKLLKQKNDEIYILRKENELLREQLYRAEKAGSSSKEN